MFSKIVNSGLQIPSAYSVAATLLCTILFTMAFSSNTPSYLLLYLCLFLTFSFFTLFISRKDNFKPLLTLKAQSPVAFFTLHAFALSSFVSLLLMLSSNSNMTHKIASLLMYAIYWLITFYCLMLAKLYKAKPHLHQKLIYCLFTGTWALMLLLAYAYFIDGGPGSLRWPQFPPFLGNIRIMGMLISVVLLAAIIMFLFENKSKLRAAFLAINILLFAAFLIWTASRMSVLAVIISLSLIFTLSQFWLGGLGKKFTLVVLILFLSAPLGQKFSLPWGGFERIINSATTSMEADGSLERFSSGRITLWRVSLSAIKESPIFGRAPLAFLFLEERFQSEKPGREWYSHNIVIDWLLEWGVIGTGLFILFLLTIAKAIIKQLKQRILSKDTAWLTAVSSIMVLTITGMADSTYFVMLSVIILATSFAAILLPAPADKQ